jgi:hypothetical protein
MSNWTGTLWTMFVQFLAQVATFRWAGPGTETWEGFSLHAASVWTLAGVILVALGWLTLPRRARYRSRWFRSDGLTAVGRVLLGITTSTVAVALATVALARVTAHSIYGLTSNLPIPRVVNAVASPTAGTPVTSLLPAWLVDDGRRYLLESSRYWDSLHVNGFAVLVAIFFGAFVGWMSSSSRWTLSGIATWLGLVLVVAGLVGYTVLIVVTSTSIFAWALGAMLLGVELFGFFLFLAYQYYTIEYIAGSAPHLRTGASGRDRSPRSRHSSRSKSRRTTNRRRSSFVASDRSWTSTTLATDLWSNCSTTPPTPRPWRPSERSAGRTA